MTIRNFSRLIIIVLAAGLASCAGQAPPTGGPSDTTHPKVDTTYPRDRQTNVPPNARLYFQFDRDVDRASFQQALSISPYVNGNLKFDWSGHNEVYVELPERMRDSTTYTVSLSRDLKSRRGNQLLTPINVTFSTGPFVDTGRLSGFLLVPIVGQPLRASDLFVFAYDISVRNRDTLNFTHSPPDLLTQPNDQGVWQFLSMKVGHRYRVFAASDVYRNKVFDPGVDAFGVPSSDAVLDSSVKSGFYIRMSPPTDTIRPELQDVEVVDSFHVRAIFSEAIDSLGVSAANFRLNGSPLLGAFRTSVDKRPGQVTLLTAQPIAVNQNYTLTARNVYDLAHNLLSDTADNVTFTAPATLRGAPNPTFVNRPIIDSSRDVSIMPTLPFVFNDAIQEDSLEHAITLTDSAGKKSLLMFRWYDNATLYVTPIDTLKPNCYYTLAVRTGGIRSAQPLAPLPAKDTTLRFHFRTGTGRDLATITGDITIADSFFAKNPQSALIVQALAGGSAVAAQLVLPHSVTHYEFDRMPPVNYRVRAYLSRTGAPVYDPGGVQPWRFGVPTGDYPKAFDTRARWTVADINFEVK